MIEIRLNTSMEKDIYCKGIKRSGVYVWGYYEGKTFIPLYVGKSRNVHERLMQHYYRFSSGEYSVPDINALEEIYINRKHPGKDFILPRLYSPLSIYGVVNIFNNNKHIVNKVLNNFTFRYIELETERDRVIAERSLANRLGRNCLITSIPEGGNNYLSPELEELIK